MRPFQDPRLETWLASDGRAAQVADAIAAEEQLRAEIEKLSQAHAAQPDWERVEAVASDLLAAPVKDLRVAGYLAHALAMRHGERGLGVGIALLVGLLTRHGDALLPLRARARVAALDWYAERVGVAITALSADGQVDVAALAPWVAELERTAADLLGAEAPSLAAVSAALRAAEVKSSVAAPCRALPPPAAPVPTSGPSLSELLDAQVDVPVTTAEQAALLAAVGRSLVRLGRARRRARPGDASAYRLLRIGGTLRFEGPPAANKRGRTELDPPAPPVRAALEAAVAAQSWDEARRLSESALERFPLWLEAHYVAARALAALGATFAEAHRVVVHEARSLHARFPELARQQFADGTHIASGEAQQWLAARDTPACDGDRAGASEQVEHGAQALDVDDALLARVVRAEPEGCASFEALRGQAPSGRVEFALRRALAGALERAGKIAQAAQLYRGLARDVAVHRLAGWEPALAVAVLRGLRRTLPALRSVPPSHPEVDRLARTLARVAPTALL